MPLARPAAVSAALRFSLVSLLVPVLVLVAHAVVAPAHAFVHLAGSGLAFPTSLPDHGQSLELVGYLDADGNGPFPFDETRFEYTWTLTGPVCHELLDPAPGIRYRRLTFGILEVRADPARNSSFLPDPPNAVVPSRFHDGDILLLGVVTELELREIFGIVTARADLRFEGGSELVNLERAEWIFNAAISTFGPEIPAGYGSRWVLELLPQQAVAVDSRTWGGIKSLYR